MNKKKILLRIKHFRNSNKTIHELKKTKNHHKNHKQLKTKNLLELKYGFSWFLKVKEHLIWTFIVKSNYLTQISIVWWFKLMLTTFISICTVKIQ